MKMRMTQERMLLVLPGCDRRRIVSPLLSGTGIRHPPSVISHQSFSLRFHLRSSTSILILHRPSPHQIRERPPTNERRGPPACVAKRELSGQYPPAAEP